MFRIFAASLTIISVLIGCTNSVTPAPSVSPAVASASPGPSATPSPSASPAVAPNPPASAPSLPPGVPSGSLPVRGPGKEIGYAVLTAAGPDGSLFVLVPEPAAGVVLARLDRTGRPSPGWPIAMTDVESCPLLLPVQDGTVRLLCSVLVSADTSVERAFALDVQGRSLDGWPVEPGPGFWSAGRVVDGALGLYGGPSETGSSLAIVAADGSIQRGRAVPTDETMATAAKIGPDGIVYSTRVPGDYPEGSPETSWITSSDLNGVREGWPVKLDGIASGPSFGPGARIVLTVGSRVDATSRVAVLDRNGVLARSPKLAVATAESGVDCVAYTPRAPLTAADGTVFLWSDLDARIFALDAALKVLPGWPYRLPNGLVGPGHDDPRSELNCSFPVAPSVGPTGTLYLPLQPRSASVGGTLVAVDLNGRVRAGWPVTLKRPGAEFLWTVVGSDGTVFALAKEPEAGNSASVTIVAFATNGIVRYRTTIIEP